MKAKIIQMIACIVAAGSLIACSPQTEPPRNRGAPDASVSHADTSQGDEKPDDNTSQDIEQVDPAEPPQLDRQTPSELPFELGRYTTGIFDYSHNRLSNITLACRAVEGLVVEPGVEFSFNQAVGPRTEERGYKKAVIFVGEEKEKQFGGGICQLSTTIYQAALIAGMEITERHEHSQPVDYAKAGEDATVYYGSLDLRFVNASEWPVQFSAMLEDDALTVSITAVEI